MKKISLFLLLMFSFLTLGSSFCMALYRDTVGPEVGFVFPGKKNSTQKRFFQDIRRLDLSTIGEIEIVSEQSGIGEEGDLFIRASENILPLIKTTFIDGELRISLSDCVRGKPDWRPKFYLVAGSLEKITASGEFEVYSNNLQAKKLEVDLQGSAKITIKNLVVDELAVKVAGAAGVSLVGSVDRQVVECCEASSYYATNLTSLSCNLELSGASFASINVTDQLSGSVRGASAYEVTGCAKRLLQDIRTLEYAAIMHGCGYRWT